MIVKCRRCKRSFTLPPRVVKQCQARKEFLERVYNKMNAKSRTISLMPSPSFPTICAKCRETADRKVHEIMNMSPLEFTKNVPLIAKPHNQQTMRARQ